MSNSQETVVALKASFLRTQIRILSQPLQPSHRWRDSSRHGGTLTDSAVADATREVNRRLRRHTKAAYSSLAVRHVAEQIDRLYWDAAAPGLEDGDPEQPDGGVIRVGDDFTDAQSIDKLPDTWDFEEDATLSIKQRSDRDAYEEVYQSVKALSKSREAAQSKLMALEKLKIILQPFEDPRESIQPSLVTRDGRLAEELSRCIELSVRVGARLGTLQDTELEDMPAEGWEPDADEDSDGDAQIRLQKAWDAK